MVTSEGEAMYRLAVERDSLKAEVERLRVWFWSSGVLTDMIMSECRSCGSLETPAGDAAGRGEGSE